MKVVYSIVQYTTTTLHYITLYCIALYSTFHSIPLHYITLYCITLHYISLHCIALHLLYYITYITLHLTIQILYYTVLYCTVSLLSVEVLHCFRLLAFNRKYLLVI